MKKWHYLGWLAWAGIFILIIFAWVTDAEAPQELNNDHVIEIKGSELRGFSEGHLSWHVLCDYIWAGENKQVFSAKRIHSGQIFDSKGHIIVKDLLADSVQVNTEQQSFIATNHLSAQFLQRLTPEIQPETKATQSVQLINISAEEFHYLGDAHLGIFKKNVRLKKSGSIIIPKESLEIDTSKNIATIQQGFTMISEQFITSGNTLMIDIDRDIAQLNSHIYIIRKAESINKTAKKLLDPREVAFRTKRSYLTCDFTQFTQENGQHEVEINGHIHAWQEDKHLTGDRGHYNEKEQLYTLEGHANFQAANLKWMLDSRRKKVVKNKDMIKSLNLPITVNCDKIQFNNSLKTLILEGHVHIIQPDKVITCDKLIYKDSANSLELEGHVIIEKESSDTFRCEKLIFDLNKEAFSAKSAIKSVFKLKKPTPF